jgi:oxygen-independent coproporphyrinogen-3 oxidase
MLHIPTPELLSRYDGRWPRYTSYPPVPAWLGDVTPADTERALAAGSDSPDRFALYVHLPFCQERCWYCGCNVVVQPDQNAATPYLDRLEVEMADVGKFLTKRKVGSIHLGGGTPNYLKAGDLERLFGALRANFNVDDQTSIDAELDPRVATPESVAHFASLGVGRMSFGVQDLDPAVGTAIGRRMDESHVRDIVDAARGAGVQSVNVDLMYGLPLQTPESIERTMTQLMNILPDRLAIYGYAHVPWMRPQQRRLEASGLLGAMERVTLFAHASRFLRQAGYLPFGLDHFARPTDELAKASRAGTLRRSFQGYTTVAFADLIGLGASAIGRIEGGGHPIYVQNVSAEKAYRRAEGLPTERGHRMSPEDVVRGRLVERVMCQLAVRQPGLWSEYPAAHETLKPLAADGLVILHDDGFEVTEPGRFFLRQVASIFDSTLPPEATQASPNNTETPRYSTAA